MWRQWEYKRRRAFPPGNCTAETLRLETAELLHKIGAFHERDVREVEVTQDLVLEATCPLLVRARQIQAAGVAAQTFLVVVVVVVQWGRFCAQIDTVIPTVTEKPAAAAISTRTATDMLLFPTD